MEKLTIFLVVLMFSTIFGIMNITPESDTKTPVALNNVEDIMVSKIEEERENNIVFSAQDTLQRDPALSISSLGSIAFGASW